MMIVGKIVTGYLADIYGRKTLWVGSCLLTAAYLPLATRFATPDNVAYILLIFGFLYGAPYAVSATYMSEELSGIGSRNRSGDLVQPWPHRRDAVAATDRHGRDALLHRPGHRPSGHRLRRLCADTCAVHQREDVRSESG